MAINWNNVPVLTDRSADLYMRSMGNLSNAIQGVGNSGINFLQRMIDRQDLIDAKNKASNTQMIINRLNQADSLDDKQRMLAEGYGDLGAIRSMLGGGEFDERVLNENLRRWDAGITQRFMANDMLKMTSAEGQKAYTDYINAVSRGDPDEINKASQNPYLSLAYRNQGMGLALQRNDVNYNRAFTEKQYEDQRKDLSRMEELLEESKKDKANKDLTATNIRINAGLYASDLYRNSQEGQFHANIDSYLRETFNYKEGLVDVLNKRYSSDPIIRENAENAYRGLMSFVSNQPSALKQSFMTSFKKGVYQNFVDNYGEENAKQYLVDLAQALNVNDVDISTNTGSDTTTPKVSDTPERQAILNTISEREKHLEDVKQQKAKGFTKPYANFKNEEERNKYYDNLLSKTNKELTEARNKLTEYDAKQTQTTELNQQIEDIVAKTSSKKEEGVVNNATPTTTNTNVNSGSNENLTAKATENINTTLTDEEKEIQTQHLNLRVNTEETPKQSAKTVEDEWKELGIENINSAEGFDPDKQKKEELEQLRNQYKGIEQEIETLEGDLADDGNPISEEEGKKIQNQIRVKQQNLTQLDKRMQDLQKTEEEKQQEAEAEEVKPITNYILNNLETNTRTTDEYYKQPNNKNEAFYVAALIDRALEDKNLTPEHKAYLERERSYYPEIKKTNDKNSNRILTEDEIAQNRVIEEANKFHPSDLSKRILRIYNYNKDVGEMAKDEIMNKDLTVRSNDIENDFGVRNEIVSNFKAVNNKDYKIPFEITQGSVDRLNNLLSSGLTDFDIENSNLDAEPENKDSIEKWVKNNLKTHANKEFNWFLGIRDETDNILNAFIEAVSKNISNKEMTDNLIKVALQILKDAPTEADAKNGLNALRDLNLASLKTLRDIDDKIKNQRISYEDWGYLNRVGFINSNVGNTTTYESSNPELRTRITKAKQGKRTKSLVQYEKELKRIKEEANKRRGLGKENLTTPFNYSMNLWGSGYNIYDPKIDEWEQNEILKLKAKYGN